MQGINLSDYPGVIYYEITPRGNVYISSTVGGYVETKEDGTTYKAHELRAALENRAKDIRELYRKCYCK